MKNKLAEIIGWTGTILVILAYVLVSFKVLAADNLIYQLMNLFGAIGVITISLVKKVYQPVVIQIVWILVAVFALLHILKII